MTPSDTTFAERILSQPASPRVAAECFAQDAESAGDNLTELQSAVLLVLRYDDVLQVHGMAAVIEEMTGDLEKLVNALNRLGCSEHATEIQRIAEMLGALDAHAEASLAEFVREHGNFDDITLNLTHNAGAVRSSVMDSLRELRS